MNPATAVTPPDLFVTVAVTIAMLVLILAVHASGIREWWQRMQLDRLNALLDEAISDVAPPDPAEDAMWAAFELQMRRHVYVSWDHCGDCYATYEEVFNRGEVQ